MCIDKHNWQSIKSIRSKGKRMQTQNNMQCLIKEENQRTDKNSVVLNQITKLAMVVLQGN